MREGAGGARIFLALVVDIGICALLPVVLVVAAGK